MSAGLKPLPLGDAFRDLSIMALLLQNEGHVICPTALAVVKVR